MRGSQEKDELRGADSKYCGQPLEESLLERPMANEAGRLWFATSRFTEDRNRSYADWHISWHASPRGSKLDVGKHREVGYYMNVTFVQLCVFLQLFSLDGQFRWTGGH